jgi:hypothetical protein
MKILRAKRDYSRHGLVQQAGKKIRRKLFFYGQEGYFNASLYEAFDDITVTKASSILSGSENQLDSYNVLVVNKKTDVPERLHREEALQKLAKKFLGPTVLLDASANAYDIPSESVIEHYDLVFKRECLKDKSEYNFSKENQAKLRTTMLACLFIPLPRHSFSRIFEKFFIPQAPPASETTDKKHDVFFCGNANAAKSSRVEAVRKLKEDPDIDFYGGLQSESENDQIPESLRFDRLDSDEYVRAMRNSKIALALDGLGQLTFRHLEAWNFGSFLLSSPSIQDITMPLSAKKDEHYAVFDGIGNLVDTVKYYLQNDSERHYIAEAGKEMFAGQYDPKKHADYINSEIMSKVK